VTNRTQQHHHDLLLQKVCSRNYLTILPDLPNSLTELRYYDNNLTNLPTLPDSLTSLDCYENKLTELPTLPDSLTSLDCSENQLTNLFFKDDSPTNLSHLICFENELTDLPLKLLINKYPIEADNNYVLFENSAKSTLLRMMTQRRWKKYYRQWIVIASLKTLLDLDTASIVASFV
jgi:Leucine-rich repeat (LRR) protein